LQPSPEAIAWGKRQAARSPRWDADKWHRIAIILQVEFPDIRPNTETDRAADNILRDAA
jgi:hypothetical protein